MTESEAKDLEVLKANIAKERELGFSYFRELDRMSDSELAMSGHRNGRDKAIADSFRNYQKRIDNLTKEYIRKYPD